MAGTDACVAKVQAMGGDKMSREDARRVLDFVDAQAERLARDKGLSPDEAVRQATKEAIDASAAAAAIERRNMLLNLQKRVTRRGRIEAAAGDVGLGREINGGQGLAGAASGIIQLAIGASILGYAAMTLKDLTKGLTPRAPNDPKTWMAALVQGGGFGILGDYLFGEYSRFGGGIGESVLGPVLGQGLTELMTLWNDAKDGNPKDLAPEMSRIILSNTPFINMFYTRAALNYLFLNSIQETLNPGYLRRSEQAMHRKTGQTYWLSPQTHLHTFGR